MEENFEYTFSNGDLIYISPKGEDGYTVNILADEPLMGTFSDFENLLYGLAPIVQNAASDDLEFGMFATELHYHFLEMDDDVMAMTTDDIKEILLK